MTGEGTPRPKITTSAAKSIRGAQPPHPALFRSFLQWVGMDMVMLPVSQQLSDAQISLL